MENRRFSAQIRCWQPFFATVGHCLQADPCHGLRSDKVLPLTQKSSTLRTFLRAINVLLTNAYASLIVLVYRVISTLSAT